MCDEWHNFQNFAKWFDENYYTIPCFRMHLDKDILVKGNRVYSPETCIFVPDFVNLMVSCTCKKQKDLPLGVWKQGKRFCSAVNISSGGATHLGTFDTPEEAFSAYKKEREKKIKKIAKSLKRSIPKKVYEAMMNYEVY